MYRERASELSGAVVWRTTARAERDERRILPDGCLDLIWSTGGGLLVAGPDTVAQVVKTRAGEEHVGLRFPPGVGPAVFGVPADQLRDLRLPLGALWAGPVVREIEERVAETPRPGRVLEAVAVRRLADHGGPDPVAAAVLARVVAGRSVAETAVEVGLGERRLLRRCQALFGYGPKTLARILRLRRALSLARAGLPAAEVAARIGYADQAHLSREVRALAGIPLGTLLVR